MDMQDDELNRVVEMVGKKAAQRFVSVRDAFRSVDVNGDGTIERQEMTRFFRNYGWDQHVADRFWEKLRSLGCARNGLGGGGGGGGGGYSSSAPTSPGANGGVSYAEFQAIFANHIQPGDKSTVTPNKKKPNEIEQLGEKAALKFHSMRDAFRNLSAQNGTLTQEDVRIFFRNNGFSRETAEKCYLELDADGDGTVDYEEFQRVFAPYIVGPQAAIIPNRTNKLGIDMDLFQVVKDIGEKAGQRFGNARRVYLWVDNDKSGNVTRDKLFRFCQQFGYDDPKIVDRLFDHLDADGSGTASQHEFQMMFSHYLMA